MYPCTYCRRGCKVQGMLLRRLVEKLLGPYHSFHSRAILRCVWAAAVPRFKYREVSASFAAGGDEPE